MDMLRRLVEILEEKSTALSPSAARPDLAKSWAEYSTRDIANFWFLHTVQSALATLRHHYYTKQGHPEELFKEMSRLGGALCTLAWIPTRQPAALRPPAAFGVLRGARRPYPHPPRNHRAVELRFDSSGEDRGLFLCRRDQGHRCLQNARWVFGIRSPIGEVETICADAATGEVCSKRIRWRAGEAGRAGHGVDAPARAAFGHLGQAGHAVFWIATTGPCWDHIQKTQEVGIYVPGELPEPGLELLIILSS